MATPTNRSATAATLKELGIDPRKNSRAQMCMTLADQLDRLDGNPAALAAVARELRLAIADLERQTGQLDDELAGFLAELSTPIRHPAQPQ